MSFGSVVMLGFQFAISLPEPFASPRTGLQAPTVKALLHASDDAIWIGTKGKGMFDSKWKMTLYDHLDGLVPRDQWGDLRDTRRCPRIGTERGDRFANGEFTNFNEDE